MRPAPPRADTGRDLRIRGTELPPGARPNEGPSRLHIETLAEEQGQSGASFRYPVSCSAGRHRSSVLKHEFDYPFELRPLGEAEGTGWLISFPDLPGCMSDGETPEEAMANGKDALAAWLQAAKDVGRDVPRPGELPSGKFVTRVPRSLHARLAARARQEGVSMNALVASFLAEGLGHKEGTRR